MNKGEFIKAGDTVSIYLELVISCEKSCFITEHDKNEMASLCRNYLTKKIKRKV